MSRSLLSDQQVAQWVADADSIVARIRELETEKKQLFDKLEALAVLGIEMPEELSIAIGRLTAATDQKQLKPTKKRDDVTWISEIRRVISESGGKIPYSAILDGIEKGPLKGKFQKSDKAFYNTISRLKKSGEVIKYNNWVFFPAVLEEHLRDVRNGVVEDVRDPKGADSVVSIAQQAIKKNPGITSGGVVKYVEDCAHQDGQSLNSGSVYNAVSRFVSTGKVKRENGGLYWVEKNETLPEGSVSSGEVAVSPERSLLDDLGDQQSKYT